MERFAGFRALHPLQSVEQDGLTWAFRTRGVGLPLLVLPGQVAVSDFAWRLFEALEGGFRVIAVDYPPVQSVRDLLRGLEAVLEAAGAPSALVLGGGFGGLAAQRLAEARPDLVLALALLNAPAPAPRLAAALQRKARWRKALPRSWARRSERADLERLFTSLPEERHFWRGFLDELFGSRRPANLQQALLRAEAELHAWGGDSPSGLHRPVLIAETEANRSAPEYALRRLPARFPQAERLSFSYGAGAALEITRVRELAYNLQKLQKYV